MLTQAARLQEDECSVLLRGMTVGAGYAMWNVKVAPCLQQLSDAVVRATYQFAKANQTVPSWVYSLPPAERKAKIDMVRRYGSPNVFAQFEPHLTVAYDTADNLTQIYGAVNAADAFPAEMVGISRVGPFGTVLKNGQLSSFSLQQDEGAKSSSFSQDYCRPSENNDWDYFLLVREWPGTMTPGALPSYINTFTLHGLWPNRNDGSWPECCNNRHVIIVFLFTFTYFFSFSAIRFSTVRLRPSFSLWSACGTTRCTIRPTPPLSGATSGTSTERAGRPLREETSASTFKCASICTTP